MFSLSGNVQMKALGFEEWMKREMRSLWIAFRSFSCKLTSDSSLPFGKKKEKEKNCGNDKYDFGRGLKKVFMSLLLTLPHIYGNWGVICKKNYIENATQEETVI